MRLPSGLAWSLNCLTVRLTSSWTLMPVAMARRTARSSRPGVLKLKSRCSKVDLVVLQRRRLGGRLGQEPDHQRVQVRLGAEVLVVADQGQALPGGVVLD